MDFVGTLIKDVSNVRIRQGKFIVRRKKRVTIEKFFDISQCIQKKNGVH